MNALRLPTSAVRRPPSAFFRRFLLLAPCSLLLTAPALRAGVADSSVRQTIAGIDVVTTKTGVKDVVTIRGSIPAGDNRSPENNVAIATLAGAMLDKGTTKHDKFQI